MHIYTYILNFMKTQLFFKSQRIYIKLTILKFEKKNFLEFFFIDLYWAC